MLDLHRIEVSLRIDHSGIDARIVFLQNPNSAKKNLPLTGNSNCQYFSDYLNVAKSFPSMAVTPVLNPHCLEDCALQ